MYLTKIQKIYKKYAEQLKREHPTYFEKYKDVFDDFVKPDRMRFRY